MLHAPTLSTGGRTAPCCWPLKKTSSMLLARAAGRLPGLAAAAHSIRRRMMSTTATAAPAAAAQQLRTLEELNFDNTFVRELPGDPDATNALRQVYGALFSRVAPTPAAGEPSTLAASAAVCEQLLGLDPREASRPEFALVFSGAAPLPGAEPYAQCYGGHQFGQWAAQLGDGRAITLGEVVNPSTNGRWELQLKGAGKTPYSRRADGRAVLRSSLREFVASEAMAALGVPTTRALSLVATGDKVLRDMFYSGDARFEPGAVVCRVAPSFVRFGTFELPVSRGPEEAHLVRTLLDYLIRHHFPELLAARAGAAAGGSPESSPEGSPDQELYAAWLSEVCARTGRLVAAWQGVGFVHGVGNTDNFSALGLTIDYGPFGFMDRFDPLFSPNLTDIQSGRRYCYRNQPEVGEWNCARLADALAAAGLVSAEAANAAVAQYSEALVEAYEARVAAKLGLKQYDRPLAMEFIKLMYESAADFTNAWRSLSSIPAAAEDETGSSGDNSSGNSGSGDNSSGLPAALAAAIPEGKLTEELAGRWRAWLGAWRARLRADGVPDAARWAAMKAAAPKFVPRQHLLQGAIDAAARGDTSELDSLLAVLERPYDDQPGADPKYSSPPPPEVEGKPGVCLLSCSS